MENLGRCCEPGMRRGGGGLQGRCTVWFLNRGVLCGEECNLGELVPIYGLTSFSLRRLREVAVIDDRTRTLRKMSCCARGSWVCSCLCMVCITVFFFRQGLD